MLFNKDKIKNQTKNPPAKGNKLSTESKQVLPLSSPFTFSLSSHLLFFFSGDVGEMFVDGSVKILGRKEQMVKDPDSGAYFSLELFAFLFLFFFVNFLFISFFVFLPSSRLETTYTQSIFVDFLSVFCGKDGVFAIISPNFDRILRWARDNHLYFFFSP